MKKSTFILFFFICYIYSSGQTPLLDAIEKNDTASFEKILASGANVNKRKLTIETRYSISRKRRLKNGKIIIDKSRRRGMPLIYFRKTPLPINRASLNGNYYFVKKLLEKGANPNKKGNYVLLPLAWAAHQGHFEIVKLLLDNKADINGFEKKQKSSPLIEAIEWKHWSIAKFLIEKGANIQLVDQNGKSALSHAAIHKNMELVKLLTEKGADVNHGDKYGECILEDACSDNHLFAEQRTSYEIIKYLVQHGASVKNRAINMVLRKGEFEIARYLIESGAPVNANLLISASNGKNFEMFRYLVDSLDLKINHFDSSGYYGSSVLRGVCRGYWSGLGNGTINIPMLQYILDKKLNVNDTNYRGETPLKLLFENNKKDNDIREAIKLLIKHGADVNIPGGDMRFSPLMSAASDKLIESAKVLIESGANVNYKAGENRSILHWAAWAHQNTDMIQLLVSKGADINVTDNDGDTPAMSCVTFGRYENIKSMIELGLDLNIRNNMGYTLLDLVSDEEVVSILKGKGAKSGKDIK